MDEKDKKFEDDLHEILSSGPDKNVHRNKPVISKPPPEYQKTTIPRISTAEILVRVIAALATLGLLIMFGFQAAQR